MADFLLDAPFPIDMSFFDFKTTLVQLGLSLGKHSATVLSWTNANGDSVVLRGTGLVPVISGGVVVDVTGGQLTGFEMKTSVVHYKITNWAISAATFFDLIAANNTAGEARLVTSGADHIRGTDFADRLTGGAGKDWLTGGLGADTLVGGAGADRFVFDLTPGMDVIADFKSGTDHIGLKLAAFDNIGSTKGALAAEHFGLGSVAASAGQGILYDQATGRIYVDQDGAGGADASLFATVQAHLHLTLGDFLII